MRVARINVHMMEQMVIHVVPVGIRIAGKQADVFVKVERAAQREIEFLLAMQAHELAINAFHGFSRGQSQDKVGIGTQIMSNDARDERRGSFVSGLYDYFHKRAGRVSLAILEGN